MRTFPCLVLFLAVSVLADSDPGTCTTSCATQGKVTSVNAFCAAEFRCPVLVGHACNQSETFACIADTRFKDCPALVAPVPSDETLALQLKIQGAGTGAISVALREPDKNLRSVICVLYQPSEEGYTCDEEISVGTLLEEIVLTPNRKYKVQEGKYDALTGNSYLCPEYPENNRIIRATFVRK